MGDLKSFVEGMRGYRSGDYSGAIEALRPLSGRKDLPGRIARYYCAMSHRAIGIAHLRSGQFVEAGRRFRQATALVGNRADLAEYLLVVYARTGQRERCTAAAEVVAQSRRDDVEAQLQLAQAQWRSGRRPMAIMTLTQALRRLGDSADLHMNLGLFYAAEEEYKPARKHLLLAVECDCTCAGAYGYLGLVESTLGDFLAAVKAFQRACTLAPENLVLAYQLCLAADASARAGRAVTVTLPEAARPPTTSLIHQLAEYAVSEPDFMEAFLGLPPSDADEELFGVVISVLRAALVSHPDYADLHYQAGAALARLGDEEGARRHARRAVEINPRYAKALVHLGELDARVGDIDAAVVHLRQAVQCGADWADVHVRLGDLLKERGMAVQAGQHYHRALKLNARYERAAEGLASLAA
jgi:tetratricopeptide (TPR) repeat protein